MLLAVDIGNTNIAAGVFKKQELVNHWKIRTENDKTCDEYTITFQNLFSKEKLKISAVRSVIISSVVPPLTPIFQVLSRNLFQIKPLVVGPGLKTGMPILYESPFEVGADRIVSSVAAFTKYGGPCIVVDFGTATTFDAVSSKGEYLGGAIAPGIQISAEALYLKTAKLPRIEIVKPKKVIGRTTVTSMQAGIYYGYIGLVLNIIEKISQDLENKPVVIATGGYADLICNQIDAIHHYEPFLVLEGLRIVHGKNKGDI